MASTGSRPPTRGAHASLQIDENMRFQRRSWTVQRIGWALMALLVIAALLGLFSVGPLSRTTVEDEAGLVQLTYQRFLRYQAPTTLEVRLARPLGPGDTVSLRLSRNLAQAIEIERIQPQPDQSATTADGLVFTFRLAEPDRPGTAFFSIRPDAIGLVQGEIGLVGQPPIQLTPFVYP